MLLLLFAHRPRGRWHACTWAGPMEWRAMCRELHVENVYAQGADPIDRETGTGIELETAWAVHVEQLCGHCRRNARRVANRLLRMADAESGLV